MTTIDKIKKLRDNNPDFAELLESTFPEIVDNKPFIFKNQLFLKRGCADTIYQLVERSDGRLYVMNLRYQNSWTYSVKPNCMMLDTDTHLTKNQFQKLLKLSGTSLSNIYVLSPEDIRSYHHFIMNNQD